MEGEGGFYTGCCNITKFLITLYKRQLLNKWEMDTTLHEINRFLQRIHKLLDNNTHNESEANDPHLGADFIKNMIKRLSGNSPINSPPGPHIINMPVHVYDDAEPSNKYMADIKCVMQIANDQISIKIKEIELDKFERVKCLVTHGEMNVDGGTHFTEKNSSQMTGTPENIIDSFLKSFKSTTKYDVTAAPYTYREDGTIRMLMNVNIRYEDTKTPLQYNYSLKFILKPGLPPPYDI